MSETEINQIESFKESIIEKYKTNGVNTIENFSCSVRDNVLLRLSDIYLKSGKKYMVNSHGVSLNLQKLLLMIDLISNRNVFNAWEVEKNDAVDKLINTVKLIADKNINNKDTDEITKLCILHLYKNKNSNSIESFENFLLSFSAFNETCVDNKRYLKEYLGTDSLRNTIQILIDLHNVVQEMRLKGNKYSKNKKNNIKINI